MAEPLIHITYDGGDADAHVIDMRLLGESLQGLDRIISDGVIAIATGRPAKRGERAPLVLKVKEPVEGSYELSGYLQELGGALALGIPVLTQFGSELLSEWVKGVVNYFSGRKDQSEVSMEAITRITELHLAARDKSEERHHEREMKMLDALCQTRDRLGPASALAAAPVGPSVRRLGFQTAGPNRIEIDEPTADRLREHAEIEWGELQTMVLRTDGFTFHTRKLSVEHPDRPGYLLADVRDPVFDEESNPYTQAAQRKAVIRVQAKPGYRSGRLEKLSIMDFGAEIDDAA
jgi:hypothetical protein